MSRTCKLLLLMLAVSFIDYKEIHPLIRGLDMTARADDTF
jgi:hypothetical protein